MSAAAMEARTAAPTATPAQPVARGTSLALHPVVLAPGATATLAGNHGAAVPLTGDLTAQGMPWPALEPRAVGRGGVAAANAGAGPVLVLQIDHGADAALYAIGSRVRGTAAAGSDLDLLALVRAPVREERRWGRVSLSVMSAEAFAAARAAGDPFAVTVAQAHRRLSGWRDPLGRVVAAFAHVPLRPDRAAALAVARACLRADVAARAPGPAAEKLRWSARMLMFAEGLDPFGPLPPEEAALAALLGRACRDPAARPAARAAFARWLSRRDPDASRPDPRPLADCLDELAALGGLPARIAAALGRTRPAPSDHE